MNSAELRIRTPEGITFAYPLAGPVTRCMAWAIDLAAQLLIYVSISIAVGTLRIVLPDLSGALLAAFWFILSTGYCVVLEWFWRGQTLGKRILRLRVMDADGFHLQFHQVLMRNLVRFADLLPGCYLVGGVSCLFSRKAQRLGDIAAGTIVVHHRKTSEPDLEQLLGSKFNSLRTQPHLCARLRQRSTPEEAQIALQALVRRDEFESEHRLRLFAQLAAHFRTLCPFPADLLEGMPDEQFVRNVVDVLFRTSEPKARAAKTPAPAAPAIA